MKVELDAVNRFRDFDNLEINGFVDVRKLSRKLSGGMSERHPVSYMFSIKIDGIVSKA